MPSPPEDRTSAPPQPAKKKAAKARRREHVAFKVARLATFLCVVCLVLGGIAAHRAFADVEDAALALGNELGKLGEAGDPRAIRLNGQTVHVAASTEDIALADALDRFESYCRGSSAALAETFDALPASVRARVPMGAGRRAAAGVVREQTASHGVVACVVRGEGEGAQGAQDGILDLVDRLGSMAESGDLSALGDLRYFHARAAKKGRTHIVAAWTDGPFLVSAMFPEGGDAPGGDPRFAPRPPDSVRLLTAEVEGAPYAVRLYDASGTPEQVFATYDASIRARGFGVLAQDPDQPTARVYHRDESDLTVTVDGDERGRSLVSLVETSNLRLP